jgi:hypothetical protein
MIKKRVKDEKGRRGLMSCLPAFPRMEKERERATCFVSCPGADNNNNNVFISVEEK